VPIRRSCLVRISFNFDSDAVNMSVSITKRILIAISAGVKITIQLRNTSMGKLELQTKMFDIDRIFLNLINKFLYQK